MHARSTRMRLGPTWAGSVSARWAARRRGDRPSEAGHGRSCPSELAVPATASARPTGGAARCGPGISRRPQQPLPRLRPCRQPAAGAGRQAECRLLSTAPRGVNLAADTPARCGSVHRPGLLVDPPDAEPRLKLRCHWRRQMHRLITPPNNSAPATFRWTATSAVGLAYAGLCNSKPGPPAQWEREPSQSAVGVPNITPPWVSQDVVYASEGSAVSVQGFRDWFRDWFRD